MAALLKKVQQKDIYILNGVEVENIEDSLCSVSVSTKQFEFTTGKLLIATNGFASRFIADDIKPARAQVLLTEPLKTLHVKGTFHLDRGYYYFRNIGNRILLGGGRNLDFSGEETSEFGNTDLIQNKLEELLQHTILPESKVKVEHRWSGIMGVGKKKRPIIEQLSDNVFCGVRLGGMGVAIGSLVGAELAELV